MKFILLAHLNSFRICLNTPSVEIKVPQAILTSSASLVSSSLIQLGIAFLGNEICFLNNFMKSFSAYILLLWLSGLGR